MALEPTRKTFSYRFFIIFFRVLFKIWFRWRVHHANRVPAEGGVILASNHTSYLDPVFNCCALDRMLVPLARESAFDMFLVGRLLVSWNVIALDQSGTGRGLKTFFDRVRAGDAVLMYPEGQRSPTGMIQEPMPGVGLVILKSTAPVVPVRLFGPFEAYSRYHLIPRPYQVQIKFGEPLDFAQLRAEAKQTKDKEQLKALYQQAATDLLHAIATLEPGPDE